MIPLLIGAAAVGLAGLALSGDDKKKSSTTTTREIPPSEVPPDVREKIDTPSEPQNSSTGNNSMDGRKFTILGETGSGKTCYLLGMYYEMSMSTAGYTVIATDPDADKKLTLRYEMLKDKSRGQNRFPAGTDQVEKLNFNLQYDYETILPFTWVDYSGNFLDATKRDVGSEQYKEVEKSIKESEMLFICIDGANLVGNGTRDKIRKVKTRCAKHINPYLTELRNKFKDEGKGGLPPIGMLITKYDMCQEDTDPDEIREIVEDAFEGLFDEEDNQNFVAIIPVSLGNTLQDDSYQGDLDPINIHLPILMGINFALIDMLYVAKAVIEEDHATVAEAERLKRYEDERWAITRWIFGGHDPDKIANIISETNEEIKDVTEIAKYFRKSLKRMNRELEKVEMIFANGRWLDNGSIRRFWHDVQQIADYNF